MRKEIELNDGTKVWVRQASGMEKLKIENAQAKVFRTFAHFGSDPNEWSPKQHEEFAEAIEEAGCGMADQIAAWLPNCVEDFDVNTLTSEECRRILLFVRGDDPEGAIPLESSPA
jgi:hypothetical protein